MKSKILALTGVYLFLFAVGGIQFGTADAVCPIQEDPEMTELKDKQKNTMKDIGVITKALADYIADNGVLPQQDGTYDENSEFYKALSPFYVKTLPVKDAWGNNFRVYCGEAGNGKYGISRCGADDFVVVSYGRDGKKESWEFIISNPAAGMYYIDSEEDFDKDLVMWNGSWIRAPMPRRR